MAIRKISGDSTDALTVGRKPLDDPDYDAVETITSLTWGGPDIRFSGIDNIEAFTTAIPEPSSFALMGLSLIGLVGLVGYGWRKKRKWNSTA